MADAPRVSYAPTEDQDLIRSTARQFLEENLPLDRVRETMLTAEGFDPVVWKEMADLGWTGLAIAEEFGGAGLTNVEMSVLVEEMGRLLTPGPFFASAVLSTAVLQETATRDQQAELLPALAAGERIATLAVFETPRDWSTGEPGTTATRRGDGWVLEGRKRAVLSAGGADTLLVTAKTRDGVGVFAVDAGADGVEISIEPVLDLTRHQGTVSLDAVQASSRLGEGDSSEGLQRALAVARAMLACEQVGGAQRCLEMAVDYAKSRYQFGRPIGSYQAIKHRCANMLMKVEHAKSVAYHAVRVADDDDEVGVAAPLAASVASEAYVWVAGENIQVHGGIGFTWEHDAHLYLKRAKSSSLLLGSPRFHRDRLGEAIGV